MEEESVKEEECSNGESVEEEEEKCVEEEECSKGDSVKKEEFNKWKVWKIKSVIECKFGRRRAK